MRFRLDWHRVLNEHRVEWVDAGANVKRGNINVRCPFCGTDDPSHHMGIDPETGWWACWRNSSHRGRNPVRLLARLLGVSYAVAAGLAGVESGTFDDDAWTSVASRVRSTPKATTVRSIELPTEFRPIDGSRASQPFEEYLESRGFDDVEGVCQLYRILYCDAGSFANRIILPIYFESSLVAWTSRAIDGHPLRYRDSSLRESAIAPKQTLYNYDIAAGGGITLVIVEGPIDALKLDFYGMDFGVHAVGLYTASATEAQTYLLTTLASRFKSVVCMMDAASALDSVDSHRMASTLTAVGVVRPFPPPFGYKDAGDFPPAVASRVARHLATTTPNKKELR